MAKQSRMVAVAQSFIKCYPRQFFSTLITMVLETFSGCSLRKKMDLLAHSLGCSGRLFWLSPFFLPLPMKGTFGDDLLSDYLMVGPYFLAALSDFGPKTD